MPSKEDPREVYGIFIEKRGLVLSWAFLSLFCVSGVVVGYPALKPILINAGVYGNLCDSSQANSKGCDSQNLKLDLMFTIATSFVNIIGMMLGAFLDRTGPNKAATAGSILTFIGSLLFGFSYQYDFDAYIPAYSIIAVGGMLLYISLFNLMNLYPDNEGFVLSVMVALFEASAVVYYIFQLFYDNLNITIFNLFLFYGLWCGVIGLASFFILPSIPIPISEESNQLGAVEESAPLINQQNSSITPFRSVGQQYVGEISARALIAEIKERGRDTAVLWQFAPVYMLTSYFYFSTTNEQLLWLTDSESHSSTKADQMTQVFAIMVPSIGFIMSPIAGRICDRYGLDICALLMTVLQILFGICSVIKNVQLQFVTFVSVISFRCMYMVIVSRFITLRYSVKSFGRMYGMTSTVSGLVSLLGYFFNYLVKEHFDGSYLAINVILLAISTMSGIRFFFYSTLLIRKQRHDLRYIRM
jgi:hypothetical protein